MTKPTDRAIAQAFRDWCAESPRWQAINPVQEFVQFRARDIDAKSACGGCGNSDPEKRCIGCGHPFYAMENSHERPF
ncbi:hypothetical protein RDV84_23285 [Lysobacter yananisis]|uniref:Uncharacterized protein n=1 Tax=Lysobacter yananisis TaxID=1003114 RepID=A0ABY9P7J1_9GAMM|nr:hypothetical protein [Lysobacter yananisis]WMT02851.1 hypothetical protein RDV84_23285 [Lysobacter yananisis]